MPTFVYDGTCNDEERLVVVGTTFHVGTPVAVSDVQATKLRRLPYFREAMTGDSPEPSTSERPIVDEHQGARDGEVRHLDDVPSEPVKRGRGRPKGSKNKPKVIDGNANEG